MTTTRRNTQPALDHLDAALEATCATLMALEATRVRMADGSLALQLRDAIASLREAIAEMRALNDVETSMVAFGFVVAAEDSGRDRSRARRRQFSPRRTA